MDVVRLTRHLLMPDWWYRRAFPTTSLVAVERAIGESESTHSGELRFAVEAGLPVDCLWSAQTPRQRAEELFARLRVWDTETNSGVLIYLQMIDRRVEIVADRGINARVAASFWETVCRAMEAEFRAGRFEAGTLAAIRAITAELARHFPAESANTNELPNSAVVL